MAGGGLKHTAVQKIDGLVISAVSVGDGICKLTSNFGSKGARSDNQMDLAQVYELDQLSNVLGAQLRGLDDFGADRNWFIVVAVRVHADFPWRRYICRYDLIGMDG